MLRLLQTEQGVLKWSIATTLVVALFGIIFGLVSGSFSIVFDGFYSLIDAAMSGVALVVTTLIRRYTTDSTTSRRLAERFNMGFWHLEPMVLALNGILLCGVILYALVSAVMTVLGGGQSLEFGYALVYALLASVVCFSSAWITCKANAPLRSDFLALDTKAWLMSGSISSALLIAFTLGAAVEGTNWQWLGPYIDPFVLVVICSCLLPMPFLTVRNAYLEILMATPPTLREHVDAVAGQVVADQQFVDFAAYVAKVGRAQQIELHFIVPPELPARTLQSWDALRNDIADALGEASPNRWLTINFTTDRDWAH
nr:MULTISPECIES: cation transporter [unclassified Pseudomonas]